MYAWVNRRKPLLLDHIFNFSLLAAVGCGITSFLLFQTFDELIGRASTTNFQQNLYTHCSYYFILQVQFSSGAVESFQLHTNPQIASCNIKCYFRTSLTSMFLLLLLFKRGRKTAPKKIENIFMEVKKSNEQIAHSSSSISCLQFHNFYIYST